MEESVEDPIARLERYGRMREAGLVSDEEFAQVKAELLGGVTGGGGTARGPVPGLGAAPAAEAGSGPRPPRRARQTRVQVSASSLSIGLAGLALAAGLALVVRSPRSFVYVAPAEFLGRPASGGDGGGPVAGPTAEWLGSLAVRGGGLSLERAQSYSVVVERHDGTPTRSRLRVWIYTSAQTFEERAQTALAAALERFESTGVDCVVVRALVSSDPALAGSGFRVAEAAYAPDGLGLEGRAGLRYGTWEARATGEGVSWRQIEVAELWASSADRFQRPDPWGGTCDDARAIRAHVATRLGLELEEVRLPRFRLLDYPLSSLPEQACGAQGAASGSTGAKPSIFHSRPTRSSVTSPGSSSP